MREGGEEERRSEGFRRVIKKREGKGEEGRAKEGIYIKVRGSRGGLKGEYERRRRRKEK